MAKVKKQNLNLENKVYSKWAALGLFLERFLSQRAGDYCQRLKYFVTEKISTDCDSSATLSAYDVDIFSAYDNIMQAYKKVLAHNIAGQQVLKTPHVRQIWEGICELILSRLLTDEDEPTKEINPVLAEKKNILAEEIASAATEIDGFFIDFKFSQSWNDLRGASRVTLLNPEFDSFNAILQNLSQSVLNSCQDKLHKTYTNTIETTLTRLNNLETRGQASSYNNLLKEEIEILRQIIVVQAVAIEKAIWQKEIAPEENEFLSEALTLLRETYQREGHAYSTINKAFLDAAALHKKNLGKMVLDLENSDDFVDSLAELLPCVDMPLIFETFKNSVLSKLDPLKKVLNEFMFTRLESFDTNLSSKKLYFCKKALWQAGQMSNESAVAFADIVQFFEANKETLLEAQENDIVKGIAETIIIKIDTLRDVAQEFSEQTDKLVEQFGEDAASRSGRDELYTLGEEFVIQKLLELDLSEKQGAHVTAEILKQLLETSFFTEHNDQIKREWAKREEALTKKVLNFKRDGLFFELSTFEEIMTYSVTRLRESTCEHVLNFVEEIDKTQKKLEAILTRFNTQKITPTAHEIFNAKEHEVLMAEVQEGFKKGEIIKTMNSGYMQDGQVIVRANVIAAR